MLHSPSLFTNNLYLDMLQLGKIKEAYKFFSEFKDLFKTDAEKVKIIETLENMPERDNLKSKYYAEFKDKRDRVAISNYSVCMLLHFLKVKRLQTIMNVLNNNVDFKKITSSKIAKTNNMIMSHLIDAGIDVESINQTPLRLQRLKLR